MTSHQNCTHPKTRQGRAECRKKLEQARRDGEAAGAKIEKANTVLIRGKEVVIPFSVAWELKKRPPHPRHLAAGEYYPAMIKRQLLLESVAEHLGISIPELKEVIRQLKRQGD